MLQKLIILLITLATVAQSQRACIRRNKPVCGTNRKDYRNKCFARVESVQVECQGKCPCPKKFEEKIVFSSTGEGVHGGLLGEYTYDSENNRYVQSNSEISHEEYEPKYLSRNNEHEDWFVGTEDGEVGWLWNGNPSQEVPEADWEVLDGEEWNVDPDLKVSKGALKPCSGIRIFGLGPVVQEQVNHLGIYKLTSKRWNGHPIYQNGDGSFLHMGSDGYWSVSDRLGEHSIRGLPGRLCPSESNTWEYWDGSKAQPAEILVESL